MATDRKEEDEKDAWSSLLKRMKAGVVVPVLGPDLLRFDPKEGTSRSPSLYHQVGLELATSVGQPLDADAATWPLFAGAGQYLAQRPYDADKLRGRVARLIEEATPSGSGVVPAALHKLASIDAFSLFISLTCDDLMARALEEADRKVSPDQLDSRKAYRRAFAVRTTGPEIDIPAPPPRRGVYQLLGSADNPLDFAIHDGDALEYLYRLQSEHSRSVRLLLGELRKRDLLLIGCCLPDWLGRSLLRLASGNALPSKSTQDYLCDPGADARLTTFLSRHSPKTLHFGGDAAAFIDRLAERWQSARPRPTAPHLSIPPAGGRADATVFVSYASENAIEARLLADQLLDLDAADVWLDKRKLRRAATTGPNASRRRSTDSATISCRCCRSKPTADAKAGSGRSGSAHYGVLTAFLEHSVCRLRSTLTHSASAYYTAPPRSSKSIC